MCSPVSVVTIFFSTLILSACHGSRVPHVHVAYNHSMPFDSRCCVRTPDGSCHLPSNAVGRSFYGHLHFVGSRKPILHGHDCTVSVKHRFMFPHVLKSGGSFLKNWLVAVLCDGDRKREGERYPSINDACAAHVLLQGSCLAMQQYRDFFTFAFVRHPKDRTISQVKTSCLLSLSLTRSLFSAAFLCSTPWLRPKTFLSGTLIHPLSSSLSTMNHSCCQRHDCPPHTMHSKLPSFSTWKAVLWSTSSAI
jgi:hypothetical protein